MVYYIHYINESWEIFMVWTAAGGVKKNIKAKMLNISLVAGLIASLAVPGLVPLFGNRAQAVELTTQPVYQTDFDINLSHDSTTWLYYIDKPKPEIPTINPVPGSYQITANPDPAVGNNGAVKIAAKDGEKFNLATPQYSGVKLTEIESLGFDLFTDNPSQTYLLLDVNFTSREHGPGLLYHGRLIYKPTNVVANSWGSHEAVSTNGVWEWSLFEEYGNQWPDGEKVPGRSWDDITDVFYDAIISNVELHLAFRQPVGGLYLRADGDKPVTAYFDNVYLTTADKNIKYNFELPSLETPEHLSPADGVTLGVNQEIKPTWKPVTGATSYEYRVSQKTTPDCEVDANGALLNGYTFVKTSAQTYHDGAGTADGTYCWQVRALGDDGAVSPWSNPWSGTVDTTAPVWNDNPVHISPADNTEVVEGSNILMQWSDATDPNGVKYYYQSSYTSDTNDSDNGFVNPIWTWGSLSESEIDATGTAVGTYYWQVRACDELGNCTDWTNPWTGSVASAAQSNSGGTGGPQVQGARTNRVNRNSNPNPSGATSQTFARAIGGDNNTFGQPQNGEDNSDEGRVEGANIENDFASTPATLAAASVNDSSSCSRILGLCWYYWPPIIVAVLTIGYIGYKRSQTEN